MASLPLQKFLLQKLITFIKHLKLLKLSAIILCIHRHVITLLRRLLHMISHNPDNHLSGQRSSVDRIMGATEPAVEDTQNQIPTVTTLAVRPPEREDAPPFQHCVTSSGAITLRAIVASQIGRYDRNITQSKDFRVFEVSPGPNNFTESSTKIANWLQLTHPEGARFFFNPLQRVFTDQNILENNLALEILAAAEQANQMAAESGKVCATMELAIEKLSEGVFGYYFVDHDARIIFWPEIVKSRGAYDPYDLICQLGYALEAQYWKHCTLFPNMRALPGQVVDYLRDIITYAHAESITSQTSLSPFDLDELSNMLNVVEHVKGQLLSSIVFVGIRLDQKQITSKKSTEHSVCIVARYMDMFFRAKFVNFCGQLGARLDADQSLYDSDSKKKPKPILVRILNVALESIHNKFISQLNSEWSSFTVFSTVMLAVDVSFLAVPGVDNPSTQSKPAVTIVVYLSTLWRNGDSRRSSAGSVANFMTSMSQSLLGIESLAFMLSLPFALLIWGMIFFAIGLSILIFYTTDIYWKDIMKHMVIIRRQ
ncbi:hypothetical protein F4604DRAFT_1821473 [Suillus subluteus]|nr:hypothetical protein F4604DRAFT_1821473 [Suillus subluteus]